MENPESYEKINYKFFSSYLNCPYKAFLEIQGERGSPEALEFAFDELERKHIANALRLYETGVLAASQSRKVSVIKSRHLLNPFLGFSEVTGLCQKQRSAVCIPVLFSQKEKASQHEQSLLALNALWLQSDGDKIALYGKIICGNELKTRKVQLRKPLIKARAILSQIQGISSGVVKPALVLNSHCKQCRYAGFCVPKAREKDDLSLISGLSRKEISTLNKRGIFTVTQLSYAFRPKKRMHEKEKHSHALKALAIREKKIYICQNPEFPKSKVHVYLDVEGIPHRSQYYLIGLLVVDGDAQNHYAFWAANLNSQKNIWFDFLSIIAGLESYSIFHYGSYESQFVRQMGKLYGFIPEIKGDQMQAAMVNVLNYCRLNVYFPVYSNGLKEIATFLNYHWEQPNASGLATIVWRQNWESTGNTREKEILIKYNFQDCEALKMLTKSICDIVEQGQWNSEAVIRADKLKREHPYRWKRNTFAVPELQYINQCAYFDYQRSKVFWRTNSTVKKHVDRRARISKKRPGINKVIRYAPPPRICPNCEGTKVWVERRLFRTILDIKFCKAGVKKWVTKGIGQLARCANCGQWIYPQDYPETGQKYGRNLMVWAVYQSIGLRLSQENIIRGMNDLFGFAFEVRYMSRANHRFAKFYQSTYEEIVAKIRCGTLVHVDETRVSIKGAVAYVWVFATHEEVLYVYSNSREGKIISDTLAGFKGVLVSDFYAAYDSFPCKQQRCLIHLIRDLNDDLLKNQFDSEFKEFVEAFAKLLRSIIATIDFRGLKKHFLRKHKKDVTRFFRKTVKKQYKSELATKYANRFLKNEDRLFTFLDYDDVPWNNNNAENAIKGFATYRSLVGGLCTEATIKENLVLLSIAQTLKNRGVSFLKFLQSAERSLDTFMQNY